MTKKSIFALLSILWGSLLSLAFLELSLHVMRAFIRYHKSTVQAHLNMPGASYRIYTLGESTTAPPWNSVKDTSWPAELADILSQEGYHNVAIENLAKVSCTTTYELEQFKKYLALKKPNLVVAMLGVNDWHQAEFYQEKDPWVLKKIFLWLKSAYIQGESDDSQYDQMYEPIEEKNSYLNTIFRASDKEILWKNISHLNSAWLTDKKFTFEVLHAIQSKSMDFCLKNNTVTGTCAAIDQFIFSEAQKDLANNDQSPRVFAFYLYAAKQLHREQEAAKSYADWLAKGYSITIYGRELLYQMAKRSQEIRKQIVADSVSASSYQITQNNLLQIATLCEQNKIPLVFMQYPTLPLASLELLLDKEAQSGCESYPQCFNQISQHKKIPHAYGLLSNENFQKTDPAKYDEYFTDRFAFIFGAHFGHLTQLGSHKIAEKLFAYLKERRILPPTANFPAIPKDEQETH